MRFTQKLSAVSKRLVSINPDYSDIVIDFPPTEDTHIKIFSVVGSDRVI